jgi:Methyltransferase domain
MPSKTRTRSKKPKARSALTAKTADKHLLYQRSVQDPAVEVRFMQRVFRAERGRQPLSLREDFCGTALLCSEWVKSSPEREATGVDLDPAVLEWGRSHNVVPLGPAAERVTLVQSDVRQASGKRHDIVCAFNFSYWIFKTRDELRTYFRAAQRGLGKEGIFLLDAYGGWESQEPMLEPRKIQGGFTYVWDQDSFDPITHSILNHIHFEFTDGTELHKAFTYDWRYWTLPELREVLLEAGYSTVRVYWDTSDDDDRESYRSRLRSENQPGWLAYLVAMK